MDVANEGVVCPRVDVIGEGNFGGSTWWHGRYYCNDKHLSKIVCGFYCRQKVLRYEVAKQTKYR